MSLLHKIMVSDMITTKERITFQRFTDHAWFNKEDVHYDSIKKVLVVKLKRHSENSKALKQFLRLRIWKNTVPPTINCVLTVKDVDSCIIKDDDPQNQKVITGGLVVFGTNTPFNNTVAMGSFCDRENPYCITIKINKINITLEDI